MQRNTAFEVKQKRQKKGPVSLCRPGSPASVAGRQTLPGRAAGSAAEGAVQEGQPITRAALQRSLHCASRLCACHEGACGAAEHSDWVPRAWRKPIFPCFYVFLAVPLNIKNEEEGHPAFFLVFWAHSKAVSRFIKMKRDTGPLFSFFTQNVGPRFLYGVPYLQYVTSTQGRSKGSKCAISRALSQVE